ncbi:MAG: orotate phosphoribosyltransferase [Christensenellales bacterium]
MNNKAAECLLKIRAVYLRPQEPFTWASGIKSPIYCDNRIVLSYPEAREVIEDGLTELIKREYPGAEAVFGTATAGIAHAALVADRMKLPTGYVRGENKSHGRQNKIEGRLAEGQKVVLVEDLISTGGSCLEAVKALREAGAEVMGVASIFTYNIGRGHENFKRESCVYKSLCDLETLLDVAVGTGYITAEQRAQVIDFRNSL